MSLLNDLFQEFQSVLSGQIPFLDVILPPLVFTLLNGLVPLWAALVIALGTAGLLVVIRIWKKGKPVYALGGTALTAAAGLLAWITQSAESFFLPGLISSGLTFLLAVISLLVRKPLAAWSSHLTRGWPIDWYWHPRIRPAYGQVTVIWTVFFFAQFAVQLYFYLQESARTLGIVQLLTGWPALILLLAGSYLYGLWRLKQLGGPSVEEYQHDQPPPWEGQQRGF